ncbi:MAG: aminotransferase class V-fold PLP-dependent enzyme, partial [Steroidobacteraceae bacterium]|nr:aminotransferase class V-fold PLP-dependent enzyme [Steroidobacteraceae bacterium]MDW8259564.1 aminotransferase class V-fold PLP-dependent enzyme [Gammaproteobacteria bacterium]
DPLAFLEREGWQVTLVEPQRDGRIAAASIAAALRDDTLLCAIQHANSETGMINDLTAIGAVCRSRGVPLFSDAAQTAGKLPLDVRTLPVDLLSFTAHKLYGPKGIGALWIHPAWRAQLQPLQFGGGQERGLRSGTLPTQQIVGFGVAARLAAERLEIDAEHLQQLTARLWARLTAALPDVSLNGAIEGRLPGILNVCFGGVEGESLVAAVPEIAVAQGSACSSASGEPSYVLRALGRDDEQAHSSLRFSPGRSTTPEDIDFAADTLIRAVRDLRARAAPLPPAGPGWREGHAGSRRIGIEVMFQIAVDSAGRVTDARYSAYGCPHTLAAADWLRRQLPGRSIDDLLPGSPADWLQALQIPREKLGRLLTVEDALRACLG